MNRNSTFRPRPTMPSVPSQEDSQSHSRNISETHEISGPPNSFSRLFLASLDRYQKSSAGGRHIGSAIEEASGYIAQEMATHDRHAGSAAIKLRSPRAVVETVLITAIVPVVGYLTNPADPFFFKGDCSWLLLAPVLLGLRHGFAPAVASAFMLDSLVLAAWRTHSFGVSTLPGASLIGLFVFAMISGQFSDVWKREIVRLDGALDVARRQLNELSREHFLLEVSYDKTLDAQAQRHTPNLREAIAAVRQLAQNGLEVSMETMAQPILDVMAAYCLIETCSIYSVSNGRLADRPAVCMGGTLGLPAGNDLLVFEALRNKRLTTLTESGRDAHASMRSQTHLLAAVPFVDTAGNVHGVLCVESMPFVAFDRKHLETLFILGGHFADILSTHGYASQLELGRRYEFEVRLRRSLKDLKEYEIPCSVFGLIVQRKSAIKDLVNNILGDALRVLDFPLIVRTPDGNYAVFNILPMTDAQGAQTLVANFANMVETELHTTLLMAGADPFFHSLGKDQSVEDVMDILLRKAQPDRHVPYEQTAVG
ncbi:PelD GGDEF domain-containing protein [Pendulispora albinea]|uniref:PelD GGDEF domain-containing protein n=1 Tax=Pendulispora albinea TaxID=2741071 RepID=A0ABZ2LR63_9BACT